MKIESYVYKCIRQIIKGTMPYTGSPGFFDLLLSDVGAKAPVAALIGHVGCDPYDLGELRYARLLEPAAAILIKLLFASHEPLTALNLIRRNQALAQTRLSW